MSKSKRVILDLSTCFIFANAVKFVELISSFNQENYEIFIIKKNWKKIKSKGVKYIEKDKKFSGAIGNYLWDPATHPDDFFENLVYPSFNNIKFKGELNTFQKLIYFFKKEYISYTSCLSLTSPNEEKKRLNKYFIDILRKNLSVRGLVKSIIRIIEFNTAKYIRYRPNKYVPFRYKLNKNLNNETVNKIITKHKNDKKIILLSVLWDENKKFEVMDDRLRGGPTFKSGLVNDFEILKKFVYEIDNKILKGEKYQFLLASKKAVDWDKYINSTFVDLRNFEEMDLCLSQMIYICQELSSITINWPSTFSSWISNCASIRHITFHDFKDTAVWCRQNLNHNDLEALV